MKPDDDEPLGEPLRIPRARNVAAAAAVARKPRPEPGPDLELLDHDAQVVHLLRGIARDAAMIRQHLFWIALPVYLAAIVLVLSVGGFLLRFLAGL